MPKVRGPRLLIYHQVGSGRGHEMNVEPSAFRRQIEWMRAHGEIVSLEEAIERRGEPDSHRLFVLTFDDGYADVFLNAFPVVVEQRIPFTLYLTSGPIESPIEFSNWPGTPIAWSQVREMVESGLATVGAHTHSHPDLRQVSKDAAADELDRSNGLIAERVGVVPKHFTYPKGWWAVQAHDAVCARYLTATLGSGQGITEFSDLHALNRLPIQRSDTKTLFSRKARTGSRVEDSVRRFVNAYKGP